MSIERMIPAVLSTTLMYRTSCSEDTGKDLPPVPMTCFGVIPWQGRGHGRHRTSQRGTDRLASPTPHHVLVVLVGVLVLGVPVVLVLLGVLDPGVIKEFLEEVVVLGVLVVLDILVVLGVFVGVLVLRVLACVEEHRPLRAATPLAMRAVASHHSH